MSDDNCCHKHRNSSKDKTCEKDDHKACKSIDYGCPCLTRNEKENLIEYPCAECDHKDKGKKKH